MRRLSDDFHACLHSGFLSGITENVKADPDLTLEIRDNYINLYYKGNSLLKLRETKTGPYKAEIHSKYLANAQIPADFTPETVTDFLSAIPLLKQNIVRHGKRSAEIEYEQMIIRANNLEPRNTAEYLIVDRQYTTAEGRFDLTGIFWDRNGRKKGQTVPVCLMEIKYALNDDIREVHEQLAHYYKSIAPQSAAIAAEMQSLFHQKLEQGLYRMPQYRIDALKTLTFSPDISQFQFVVIFVDYNPNSSKLNLQKLSELPFANQIRIFHSGFAMWQQNVQPLPAG
ncbi:MAG: hypothetical protein KF753_06610 [Caldilineaceae bacterium]|nr:hypothetical protein [Caldilineaceae bacterium]